MMNIYYRMQKTEITMSIFHVIKIQPIDF